MIVYGGIPIVSLDKIYLSPDEQNILFLDCTRLEGSKKLVSRTYSNKPNAVELQIQNISTLLLNRGVRSIVLADDVVFSGSVLRTVINLFKQNGISVVGIRSAISTINSYKFFNDNLALGLKCEYLLSDNVIDQICERDFYFGVAGSGISVVSNNNLIYKSPYFIPFGNPVSRASIPESAKFKFSRGCLTRSIILWEEIERLSQKEFYIRDLPEKIIGTQEDEQVVKTLKKEWKKL